MKYYANMKVNRNTTLQRDLESTNKIKLARQIARSAKGNCFLGNTFVWKVWDENGIIVAAGAGMATQRGFSHYDCKHHIGELIELQGSWNT